MKTIGHLTFVMLMAFATAVLPHQLVAQDKAADLAKRIEQLEKENAQLRAEIRTLRAAATRTQVPELTPAQRDLLAQAKTNASRSRPSTLQVPPPPEHRELYFKELALAQKYYDYVAKQFEGGRSTLEELSRAQRQLFALKREVVGLDASHARLKETVQEELDLVTRLLKDAKKRIAAGTAPPGSELDLEREVLKLKRELLALE